MRAQMRTEILTVEEKITNLRWWIFISTLQNGENQSFATTRGRTREANIKS